ncbi:hypothetical protein NJ7G_2294 [Natrinema sp. J7-2]|nr:hypothetical protein NJ7G_2294 [Natrinema sp. J7-2]
MNATTEWLSSIVRHDAERKDLDELAGWNRRSLPKMHVYSLTEQEIRQSPHVVHHLSIHQ